MRSLRIVVVLAVVTGAALVWKRLLDRRAAGRGPDTLGPSLGSLDTWPAVPRKEAAPG
jgi:hypothetical protein